MMSWLWFRTIFAAAALIYFCTVLVGILGNFWVVASVLRTTKKGGGHCGAGNGLPSIRPSDRLRKYIWLLAVLDLLVSSSLVYRLWALVMPDQQISTSSCRFNFALDHLFKFCSLTCLAAISTERYITIKKPFNNKVRKLAVQLTPIFALLSLLIFGTAILWLTFFSIWTSSNGMDCEQQQQRGEEEIGIKFAGWILTIGFCAQLAVIGTNYVRIVHHVRRKFWQRKARAVASSFSVSATTNRSPLGQSLSGESQQRIACGTAKLVKQQQASPPPPPFLVVAEPKYMREMRTAILRIAIFHLVCWLPFCLLQLGPVLHNVFPNLDSLKMSSSISIRILESSPEPNLNTWIAFLANWLTYANSAGNWVLYAALNRDLRSIIKACSERRKRSTLSHHPQLQQHSPYLLRKSVRRNAFQTLRLFYSINSHRSSASVECDNNSGTTIICAHHQQNPQNDTTLRAPCGNECAGGGSRKQSAQSAAGAICSGTNNQAMLAEARKKSANSAGGAELGAFGWRDGRAHTYCGPKEREATNDIDQWLSRNGQFYGHGHQNASTAQFASTQSAHLRVAQQIIAAVYGSRNAAGTKMPTSTDEMGGKYHRKESASERRELFAKKHRQRPMMMPAPPPIQIGVSIMGASTSSEEEEGLIM